MADRRLYRGWLAVVALVSIAGAIAWLAWRSASAPEPQADAVPAVLPAAVPQLPASQVLGAGNHKSAPPATGAPAGVTDPVGSAPDLNRVFEDYIDSSDPRQRRTAVRAFEACVPAFLPGAGQSPSPEPLIRALPPDRRAEREAAYRALFARCHRLLAGGRASLDDTLQTLQRDPQNQTPGLRAQEALLAGRLDDIEPLVTEALEGADPAAVESLTGIAARIVRSRQSDSADAAMLQRAREIDAALPWVACDLGLDCSAQSLWALQLCAIEGLCEGDVSARLMARISPGSIDAGAVQQQRLRLLGLIRSGRTLGTADLLPR
jgi:hypothetical protein